jgi:hypothetical protein
MHRPYSFDPGTVLRLYLFLAGIGIGLPTSVAQQSKSPAEWLPPNSVLYLQVQNVGTVWRELESLPMVKELLTLPDVQKAMQTPQYRQAMLGKTFIEGVVGQELRAFSEELTQTPAWLAVDSNSDVGVVFSPPVEAYERLQKSFADYAAIGNLSKDSSPFRAVTYKGISAFTLDKVRIAFHAGRIVVCSSNSIGKAILDRALGEEKSSLATTRWFQNAQQYSPSSNANSTRIAGAIDLKALRDSGKLELPTGREIGPELLVGGVVDAIQAADVLNMAVDWNGGNLETRLSVAMPKEIPETRQYFFGKGQIKASPNALNLKDRILSVRWHRDIGNFWNMIPQIITDENALAEVAKSESEIATLFGGMISVGELFDYLGPGVELVACQPNFPSESKEIPEIQLPKFGIVGTLRDAEKAERALRLAFQQVVSLSNLNAGAGKYPPVEVTSEKVGSVRYLTASYLQLDSMKMSSTNRPDDVPSSDLYLNFSPTLVIDGERFALSSDRNFAERLLNGKTEEQKDVRGLDNSVIELWPKALVDLARTNFEALVAQRMLETGKNREAVVSELEIGLTIVRCIEKVRLSLTTENGNLIFSGRASLATK